MNKRKNKEKHQMTFVLNTYISCKCNTHGDGHFSLDAHASSCSSSIYKLWYDWLFNSNNNQQHTWVVCACATRSCNFVWFRARTQPGVDVWLCPELRFPSTIRCYQVIVRLQYCITTSIIIMDYPRAIICDRTKCGPEKEGLCWRCPYLDPDPTPIDVLVIIWIIECAFLLHLWMVIYVHSHNI